MAATVQHIQTPAYYNQVVGRACLAGGDCGTRAFGSAPTGPPTEAERAWFASKDTASIPALEALIARFGDTYFADLAKLRLAELMQAEATAKAKAEEEAAARAERQRLTMLRAEEDLKRSAKEIVEKKKAEEAAQAKRAEETKQRQLAKG